MPIRQVQGPEVQASRACGRVPQGRAGQLCLLSPASHLAVPDLATTPLGPLPMHTLVQVNPLAETDTELMAADAKLG